MAPENIIAQLKDSAEYLRNRLNNKNLNEADETQLRKELNEVESQISRLTTICG
jgi:5-bromo-4-chloroindolyl phosphate hydrolysis protein